MYERRKAYQTIPQNEALIFKKIKTVNYRCPGMQIIKVGKYVGKCGHQVTNK